METPTLEVVAVHLVGLIGFNLAFRALAHFYKTFLRPGKNLAKLGKWAVVTGATGTCVCSVNDEVINLLIGILKIILIHSIASMLRWYR